MRQMQHREASVLYSSVNGQPVERSKMRRYMFSFGNSQDKRSRAVFVLNFLRGTEDSQTGENCSSQRGKEQRQKQDSFSRTKTKNATENKEKD